MAPFLFHQLFEPESSTFTYILADPTSLEAVIIDPVLEMGERDLQFIKKNNFILKYILETHVHADHVTGSQHLKSSTGARTAISKMSGVDCADILLNDGDVLRFGEISLTALSTPGHTKGCMSFLCCDRIFTGDTLLIGGTGRTDFQEGSSEQLYESIHTQIFTLPDATFIYPGHDYKGQTFTTVGQEKMLNPRIGGKKSKAEFVKIMAELNLAYPQKIDTALPANLRCGKIQSI